MLRMIQCQSAEQAKDYHNDALAQSDYYLNDQELKGSFQGRIARRLGIVGEAQKLEFDFLCENINPLTGRALTPRKGQQRTVGYDINFHCPKSVSVLHVLSKDDHILDAFRQCVHDTMLDIESDSKTRVRKKGKDEERETGELLWAEFIHQTARPVKDAEPDPHLHCHCFTFNVTWDKVERQYKAGQFRDIKRDMPYYQARFHKRLSDSLIALGYQVRRTKTSFEVVGVPENVIDLFSKRTNEIGQIAKEQGITDAKQLDQLGARTRVKKKKGLTMAALKKEWRRQIFAMGMTGNKNNPIRYAPGKAIQSVTAGECVDHALLHRFERASVVHDRRILESAYRHSLGYSGATVEQITNQFNYDNRILSVKDGSRLLCTTKEVLAEEKRMVELARRGKGQIIPLYTSLPDLSLQGEQADAVHHVLKTTDRVSIIRGRAGTGKTTLMKEYVKKVEAKGKKLIVVAPTAQASRGVLKDEGFTDAETVSRLLSDADLHKRLTDAVLWVDEAGLLGTKEMTALLGLATKYNAQVILSGDTRQHSSVARGDALRVLDTVAGITPVEVSKIYRQRHAGYRKAVSDLSKGDVKTAFTQLDRMGAIKSIDPMNDHNELVDDYMAAISKGKTALVISPTHAQSDAVTSSIRLAMRKAGKIGKKENSISRLVNLNMTEAEKSDVRSYQVGQVIQFNQNRQQIPRGSVWSVADISDAGLVIMDKSKKSLLLPLDKTQDFNVYCKTEIGLSKGDAITITRNSFDEKKKRLNNGQVLKIDGIFKGKIIACNPNSKAKYILPDDFGHITHAYCVTSHASQGKTVDEVFIAQPAATFPATDIKQFYVSVSRARDMAHIYTDDKEGMLDYVSQSGERQSAMELIKEYHLTRRKRPQITPTNIHNISPVLQQPVRSHAPKPYI